MEGTFPDYERVIPSQFPVSILLDAKALLETVSRVAVMADKTANNRVDLFYQGWKLADYRRGVLWALSGGARGLARGDRRRDCLSLQRGLLGERLEACRRGRALFVLRPTSPSVVASLKDTSYLAMVVPLRTG